MTLRLLDHAEAWALEAKVKINAALTYLDGLQASITAEIAAAITALKAASNTWSNTNNFTGAIQSNGVSIVPFGKHKKWVPVDEMTAGAAGGAAAATMTGSSRQWNVLDFDQTTGETAFFTWSAPSSWNEGTVTFVPVWTADAGTGDVVWGLQGVAISNDDVLSGTYSTTASSTDTLIATGDMHRGPESGTLTIEGTPAANDLILFRVLRSAANVNDTLTADARLIGYELYYTTDAAVDVS